MADYAPVQETLAAPAGPPIDPDVLDQRRKLAQALIAQAMGGEPIGSWTQGVANLAQALMGGYTVRKANQQEAAGRASAAADLAGIFGDYGGGTADLPGTEAVSTAPSADVTDFIAGGKGSQPYDLAQATALLRQGAIKRGMDPDVVVQGFKAEGLVPGTYQSRVRTAGGGREQSYGPLQLYAGGGLGNEFMRQTGLNLRDPRTVPQQIEFGLNKLQQGGWTPWNGPTKVLGYDRWRGIRQGGGGGETAALPNVDPVSFAPSPDVMAFIGGDGQSAQPAGLSIGDPAAVARLPRPRPEPPTELPYDTGADPRTPQPRPNLAQAQALPPASGRGTVPLPPVHPLARTPQPRPTTPLDPAAGAPAVAAAAPVTTGSIAPQAQPRRQIFREPYPGTPLSAQEFARQGQNYLTGRGSFANQTPRVAPRTMQEPVGPGTPGGAPVAAAPGQPRRGLLDALFGRGAPGGAAAAQAAPAGSPVAAGAPAAPAAASASSRVSALLTNPYVSDAVKAAVLARLMPKDKPVLNVPAGGTVFDPNTNQPLYTAPDKPEPRKIQSDSNGVPRYVDTGEPVFGSDTTGGKPPVKITDVTTMRKEIQDLPGVKAYKLAIPSQNSMAENFNKNTRASDLDFIYAMAKIFDPTSVVREAEQVAVKNSQGLPDQVVGYINAVNGGATLSPETRRALWETTGGRMKQYREAVDAELAPFPGIAGRWGIDPRDIMPELVEMKDLPAVDKSTAAPIIH